MPQLNKGGKFVFGKSLIREDGSLQIPPQAVEEYAICSEGRVYLFTGAKATGGFCVTRRGLLLPSKLGHILEENPALRDYALLEGSFIPYKGRKYCWLAVSPDGWLRLTPAMLQVLDLAPGQKLMAVRSSIVNAFENREIPILLFDKLKQAAKPPVQKKIKFF